MSVRHLVIATTLYLLYFDTMINANDKSPFQNKVLASTGIVVLMERFINFLLRLQIGRNFNGDGEIHLNKIRNPLRIRGDT